MQPNGDQACIDTLSALSANKCPTNAIYIFKYPMSHFSKNIISALLQTWFSIDCSLCASDFKIAQYRPLFTCSLFIFSMIKKQITLCCCGDLLPINFGLFGFFAKSVELHFLRSMKSIKLNQQPIFRFLWNKIEFPVFFDVFAKANLNLFVCQEKEVQFVLQRRSAFYGFSRFCI